MQPVFEEISRDVSRQLCVMHAEPEASPSECSTSLIFPVKRTPPGHDSPPVRISEAEARLLFALSLDKRRIPFAVEAPTREVYSFKGSTPMSGRIDLLCYAASEADSGVLERNLGIEFKAHNPVQGSIRKDVEKLIREGHDGLWFHVLKNVDSGTLGSLFGKFREAFDELSSFRGDTPAALSFSIVVIEKRLWLFRTFGEDDDLDSAFGSLEYRVERGRVIVVDAGGWRVEGV